MEIKCVYTRLVQLDKLIPHPRNDNRHKPEHAKLLAKVFKARDIRHPIIISKRSGFIVAGHLRLDAAIECEMEEFPVDEQDFANEAEEYAFLSSDNNVARYAEFDDKKFKTNLEELGIELEDFDPEEYGLMDYLPPVEKLDPMTDPDSSPGLKEDPISKKGDIWLLGEHRVMCGDSVVIDDVNKLMNGQKADMCFTDPPYNVDYQGSNGLKIKNDKKEDGQFYQFLYDAFISYSTALKEGGAIYVAHADLEGINFRTAFKDAGYQLRSTIIWNKNALVMGRGDYHWKHEPILYGWKSGASHGWYGDRSQTTVWDMNKPARNDVHPTMKPVELVEKAISNSTKTGDLVVDLFMGSGTTLIASEKNDRKCYGMELDERYCDVIIKRWQEYIGQDAVLESNGKTYKELSNG